jgi:LuxR family maltose regulon positive regulatory protein
LTTKLYIPPPRPTLVSRPRLLQKLDEGLHLGHRLTLVSAPAGSGKTTLLSDWLSDFGLNATDDRAIGNRNSKIQNRVAWLTLDEGDNVLVRFWTYAIAALQTVYPELGRSASQALQSPQPPPIQGVLTSLLNELAAVTGKTILVLDDYHAITTPAIHEGLAFLLDHLPPSLHLVVATRADPPLPNTRLRARGQLTEVRIEDLRFTAEEAETFLNEVMELALLPEDVQTLEARTEGWAVGLQLAALSMQGRTDRHEFVQGFAGSHHYILEYLTEEVVRNQPEPVQQFLIQTSMLERLCGPLCEAVTGERESAALLARLQRSNLFLIPLDDEHRWYRYHRLFADLLRNRLRQQSSPAQIAALYRRASEWHELHGSLDEAIQYALTAEDYERAVQLLEENAIALTASAPHQLMSWVEALPDEQARRRPILSISRAWSATFSGQFDAVWPWLQAAQQALPPVHETPAFEAQYLLGNIAALHAFLAERSGNMAQAIEFARQAGELLPEADTAIRVFVPYVLGRAYRAEGELAKAEKACAELERFGQSSGNVLVIALARCELATLRKIQGRLSEAERLYREFLEAEEKHGGPQFGAEAIVDVGWCDLLYEQNRLDEAQQRAEHVLDSLTQDPWWGAPTDFELVYTTLARVAHTKGDRQEAHGILDRAEQARRQYDVFPGFRSQIDTCRVRLWLAEGNLGEAVTWVQQCQPGQGGSPLTRELEQAVLARVWLAQGESDEALQLLAQLAERAEVGGRRGRLVEILALQALVHQVQGDADQALAVLEKSLSLAEPQGYVRLFVDEGPQMAKLLRQAVSRGIARGYARKLLAVLLESEPLSLPDTPSLVEKLTRREIEVLQLIGQGYSNREIAAELVLSPNTVKRHTSNLYGKLGVNSRTQAIARARELNWL